MGWEQIPSIFGEHGNFPLFSSRQSPHTQFLKLQNFYSDANFLWTCWWSRDIWSSIFLHIWMLFVSMREMRLKRIPQFWMKRLWIQVAAKSTNYIMNYITQSTVTQCFKVKQIENISLFNTINPYIMRQSTRDSEQYFVNIIWIIIPSLFAKI